MPFLLQLDSLSAIALISALSVLAALGALAANPQLWPDAPEEHFSSAMRGESNGETGLDNWPTPNSTLANEI